MDTNMLLYATFAVILLLIFYKPNKQEKFDPNVDWVNGPECNKDVGCETGLCINESGLRISGDEKGKCLVCKNQESLVDRDNNVISCSLPGGDLFNTCPSCDFESAGTLAVTQNDVSA